MNFYESKLFPPRVVESLHMAVISTDSNSVEALYQEATKDLEDKLRNGALPRHTERLHLTVEYIKEIINGTATQYDYDKLGKTVEFFTVFAGRDEPIFVSLLTVLNLNLLAMQPQGHS